MQLKKLQEQSETLKWPVPMAQLPVVSWDDFVAEAKHRPIMAVHGYIIDCESFEQEHPGGAHLIKRAIGTDATTAFFGGVYDHSNAAHNLLGMMRVGILEAGMEVEHLKDGFESSPINPDRKAEGELFTTEGERLPNAAERLQQTQLNSQLGSRPKAPMGQPQVRSLFSTRFLRSLRALTFLPLARYLQATMADKYTLNVPPSEHFRIVASVPPLRPGRESRSGELGDVAMTNARSAEEDAEYNGSKLE